MKITAAPFNVLPWLVALMFSSLLAACGGGGGQDPIPPVPPASVVVSVAVTPTTSTVPINGVQAFVAVATFGDGSTRDVSATTSWTSDAVSIATVVQASGLATGVSPGTALITATYGGKTHSATVTVTAASLLSVAITPATATVAIAGIQPFVATASYSDGSTRDVTAFANWSSGTTTVGTVVQSTGVVTGIASGSSLITANFGGKSGTASLTVNSATLVSVVVTPATATVAIAGIQTFVATASYSDGSTRDVTAFANWSSGTTKVGTVVQTTGVVTGIASGSSPITAHFGGKSGPASLTVNSATLVSVAVTPAAATVQIGVAKALKAMATYSDASVVDITSAAVWSSNMPLVVTVVANTGVATGVAVGTATVTAVSGGKSASAAVTVMTVSAPSGPATVNLGTSGNFVALAKAGISTTGATAIVGDIGVSPAAASFITGFGLIADATNTFSTSSLVTGKVYAANYAPPTPAAMTTAISDMQTAFTDAAGRTLPDATELGAGNISGMTLAPGLYKWGTGVLVTGVGVTLSGGPNAVWIFQIGQDLTISNSAMITLSGGAQAKNVFWQVSGKATLGTAADFKGNLLSQTLISAATGAVVTGRLLAQTAITLDAARVTAP